jgi:hypothetical protein
VAAPGGMKRVIFNPTFLATVKEFPISPMRLSPGLKLRSLKLVAEYREHRYLQQSL